MFDEASENYEFSWLHEKLSIRSKEDTSSQMFVLNLIAWMVTIFHMYYLWTYMCIYVEFNVNMQLLHFFSQIDYSRTNPNLGNILENDISLKREKSELLLKVGKREYRLTVSHMSEFFPFEFYEHCVCTIHGIPCRTAIQFSNITHNVST